MAKPITVQHHRGRYGYVDIISITPSLFDRRGNRSKYEKPHVGAKQRAKLARKGHPNHVTA